MINPPTPIFSCCCCLPLENSAPRSAGSGQQGPGVLPVWEGFCESPSVVTSRGGCLMKGGSCSDERGAFPVSGRQGQAPLSFLPPPSKCHLCESAAAWPPGRLLSDAPFPPLDVRANPLPAPPAPGSSRAAWWPHSFVLPSGAERVQGFDSDREGLGAAPRWCQ